MRLPQSAGAFVAMVFFYGGERWDLRENDEDIVMSALRKRRGIA
jgi:hypothetical protein